MGLGSYSSKGFKPAYSQSPYMILYRLPKATTTLSKLSGINGYELSWGCKMFVTPAACPSLRDKRVQEEPLQTHLQEGLIKLRALAFTVSHIYYTSPYTLHYSTVQYSAVQCSTVQYSAVQRSTLHYTTLHYMTLPLPYLTLPSLTFPYLTVPYLTFPSLPLR